MNEPIWDGVTRSETLNEPVATIRQQLADRAKASDWSGVLAILTAYPTLVNATRPGGRSLYATLHQAAYDGAPVEVVHQLLARGAWRTLRTARGERSSDIAERRGHTHLAVALTPILRLEMRPDVLMAIQGHLHALIRERVGNLVREHVLRLPELEPLLELPTPRLWFPVPGMYGGFGFQLDHIDGSPVLVTKSWWRVVEGSGQRHIVSAHGNLLLEEGFV